MTDDVSLMAVPAKMPNASPFVVEKPSSAPSAGKKIAASMLKKKMTEIACATSSSSASMTEAVAATAEPPQIDEPTPTSVEILPGMCISLCSSHATTSDVVIVTTMIGSDCLPVCQMTDRFMPKPSRMTAYCSTFFDTNEMPDCAAVLSCQSSVTIIPARMPNTGPPTIGNFCPSSQQGTAITRHTRMPRPFF